MWALAQLKTHSRSRTSCSFPTTTATLTLITQLMYAGSVKYGKLFVYTCRGTVNILSVQPYSVLMEAIMLVKFGG